jgi:hypothetical protein
MQRWLWGYGGAVVILSAIIVVQNVWGLSKTDWAAWVQAIGSIGAILGAFYLGSRQAQWQARAEDRRIRAKYLSIANVAIGYVEVILDSARPDSGGMLLAGIEAQRLIETTSAMKAIPLHELGSPDVIVAWSTFIKNLRWLNETYANVTDSNTAFPQTANAPSGESARRTALTNAVNHTKRSFHELHKLMIADDS